MNLKALLIGAAVATAVAGASGAAASTLLYYGGDFDPSNENANGLANEVDTTAPDGEMTYDNFVVTGTWQVTALFTNNLSGLDPTEATWEIRTGVSEGNGGTVVESGTSTVIQTATGRTGFGLAEYQDLVAVDFTLGPGTYWMSVVPLDPDSTGRSFNSNTFGLNAVGTHTADLDFFNSPHLGVNFTNANGSGTFPGLSDGVYGSAGGAPELSTWAMMGLGLAGLALAGRRKRRPAPPAWD